MPSSKRSPITYAPAFGGGIFRSKDEIAGDLAHLAAPEAAETPAVVPTRDIDDSLSGVRTNERTNGRSRKRTSGPDRLNERTNGRVDAPIVNDRTDEATIERTNVRTVNQDRAPQRSSAGDRPDERSNGQPTHDDTEGDQWMSNERTTEPEAHPAPGAGHAIGGAGGGEERARVRHSFDIYRDQLLSLGDIQLARHRQTGRKPKLGDLVQEALDAFVARERRPTGR